MPSDPTRVPDAAVRALARQLGELQRKVDTIEAGQRTSQLGNSSIDDGTLWATSNGVNRVGFGEMVDGKFGWFAVNGAAPPRPAAGQLIGTTGGVAILWNGEFVGPKPSDFTYVKAHLSPAGPDFIVSDGNIVGRLLGKSTYPVTAINEAELTPGTQYWCKLVAYNTSDMASEESIAMGPATPLAVVATEIAEGIVGRTQIALDAVDGARIAAGSVDLEHVTFTAQDLGSIVTYAQATAPAPTQSAPIAQGSLWMDTDDGNKLYRWNGLQWNPARDADIAAALSVAQQAQSDAAAALDAAADAEAKADGVVDIFYSSTAPSGAKVGDLWFNQAAGNKVSRWSGSAWVAIDDSRIGQALANAATAQTTADGKIRSFYSGTAPSGASVGDLWYDTGNGNRPSRWNGSGWTPLPAGANAIADDSIKTRHVTARQIQALQIAVETILAENIATDAVDARIIKALSILAQHIAANQIEAGHIKAGAITADKLEALLTLTNILIAGDPNGWRTEIGDAVTPLLYWDGQKTGFAVSRDQATGQANVYMSGRVEFGNGSSIEQDYIDLCEQPAAGVFRLPVPRQQRTLIYSEPIQTPSPVPSWVSATARGNLLYMAVEAVNYAGTGAPTISVPSGWQLIRTVTGGASGSTRMSTYYIAGSAHTASRTTEAISANVPCSWAIGMLEPTGMQTATPLDVSQAASGSGTAANTGTTAAPAQGNEFQIAAFGTPGAGVAGKSGFSAPTNGFSTATEGGGYKGQGLMVATKVVTGALAASAGATVTPSNPWLASIATFRTGLAPAVPTTPPAKVVRLFTRSLGGESTPWVVSNTGRTYPVGRVPYCAVALTGNFTLAANLDVWAQSGWNPTDDPYGMVSISGQAGTFSSITIPVAGRYLINYRAIYEANVDGAVNAACFINKNTRDFGNSIARDSRRFTRYGSGDHSPVQAIRPVTLEAGSILYWGNWSQISTNVFANVAGLPTEITVTYVGSN